jgi:hypothetical protein
MLEYKLYRHRKVGFAKLVGQAVFPLQVEKDEITVGLKKQIPVGQKEEIPVGCTGESFAGRLGSIRTLMRDEITPVAKSKISIPITGSSEQVVGHVAFDLNVSPLGDVSEVSEMPTGSLALNADSNLNSNTTVMMPEGTWKETWEKTISTIESIKKVVEPLAEVSTGVLLWKSR